MAYGQIERRFQVQPQAEGLLQTLHDSLAQQEKFAPLTGATPHAGETAETDADVRDRARKLMHRLVAATNRCLHKGFPSIYAYLLGKPTHYTSHQFVPLVFEYPFRAFWAALPMQQSQQPIAPDARGPLAPKIGLGAESNGMLPKTAGQQSSRGGASFLSADYDWRPRALENYPVYFFVAATDLTYTLKDGLWMWFEPEPGEDGYPNARHPCYEHRAQNIAYHVKSKKIKSGGRARALTDPRTGKTLTRYDHYRSLRMYEAWSVPVLQGKMPQAPKSDSTWEQKGKYAMCLMMLFRPWRSPKAALRTWLPEIMEDCSKEHLLPSDDVWSALYHEFLRWRETLLMEASPLLRRGVQTVPTPPYNSPLWWTCLIHLRLSNLELVLSRKRSVKESMPTDIGGVPVEEDQHSEAGSQIAPEDVAASGQDAGAPFADADAGFDDVSREERQHKESPGQYPAIPVLMCSSLPSGADLHQFLGEPSNLSRKGPNAKYARDYVRSAPCNSETVCTGDAPSILLPVETRLSQASSQWLHALAVAQEAFFKKVDLFDLDISASSSQEGQTQAGVREACKQPAVQVRSHLVAFARRAPSHTLVIEAAAHLIVNGVCHVRGKGGINVKWALALLHFSIWVQLKMSHRWVKEKMLEISDSVQYHSCKELQALFTLGADVDGVALLAMIITGAAGTGKTSILRILVGFLYIRLWGRRFSVSCFTRVNKFNPAITF